MESDTYDATRLIDIELAQYDRRILELKARRNTCIPIARLPDQVLLEIFAIIRADSARQKWHHVAHICRHWRWVALDAADLWTKPPASNHEYTLIMLERSRNSPLDIFIRKSTARATSDAIFRHLGRIKSLTLMQDTEELEYLQNQLVDTTLQLHKLTIHHSYLPLPGGRFRTPKPLRLAPWQTTSLQSVHLFFADMDWKILPIRSLKSLELMFMQISRPPSWAEFQNALHEMPHLNTLKVNLADFLLDFPGPSLSKPLYMPSLQTLEVTATTQTIIYFLSNTASRRLQQLKVTTRDNGDYQSVIRAMATKMNIGSLDFLSLRKENCALSQTPPLSDKPRLDFFFPYTRWQGIVSGTRIARSMMAELTTHPTLRIVSMELHVGIPSSDMLEIFGHSLPHLKSLRVFVHWKAVIDSLIVAPTHIFGEPIPFASLRTIMLEDVRCDTDFDDVYTSELREPLCECLRTRMDHNSPISKVSLDCDLTLEQFGELSGLVDDLEIGEILD